MNPLTIQRQIPNNIPSAIRRRTSHQFARLILCRLKGRRLHQLLIRRLITQLNNMNQTPRPIHNLQLIRPIQPPIKLIWKTMRTFHIIKWCDNRNRCRLIRF